MWILYKHLPTQVLYKHIPTWVPYRSILEGPMVCFYHNSVGTMDIAR